MESLTTSENADNWRFNWGEKFSSSKAYKFLKGHEQIHIAFKWLWACPCQPKHKVFFWLLLKNRLSTRNILKRRNMHLESYNCVLCLQNTEETCQHLFLQCPFAVQCWQLINADPSPNDDFPEVVSYIKDRLQSQFFMTAVILMCWAIWKSRNNMIFDGIQHSVSNVRQLFQREILLLQHRVKSSLSFQFEEWCQNLL